MKIGLIARADNSGLGTQTYEFYRHMKPAKTLVMDVGHLHDSVDHCNKNTDLSRYPGAQVVKGWSPSPGQLSSFLDGLDLVFTCESPYNYDLFIMAESRGIKTVLQYNWEFLDYLKFPDLPPPSLFAAPTTWHYDEIPFVNKVVLPVPLPTDGPGIFSASAKTFLHTVGRPAIYDRNGTEDLLKCLPYIKSDITIKIRCQEATYVTDLVSKHNVPSNINLVLDLGDVPNYWDNYKDADVLVLPRRYGGLCLPANEAIAMGMPVIMSDISPNNWLPSEWLVPAKKTGEFMARSIIDIYSTDPVLLAHKINQFANSANGYREAKVYARELRHKSSWGALRSVYTKTFNDLLRTVMV